MRQSFVRISALLWADILVAYALFVMQNYLTGVWDLSLTHAAGILNVWNGIYRILPLVFLYLVDAFLGNFKLLVVTSISYSAGIAFVAMSAPPILANSTNTCKEYEPRCIGQTQQRLFYAGMALIAVGVAGNFVSLKPFLAEQRGEANNAAPPVQAINGTGRGRASNRPGPQGDLYQVLGLIGVLVVGIAGAVALPYIRPWHVRFGIPAICTAFGTFLFLSGSCCYTKARPKGSPLCKVFKVYVAALIKIFEPRPVDEQRYHGNWIDQKTFSKTRCLRGLHKAAIKLEEDGWINRWFLCSVAEVEDAKIALRMVPMWMTFLICGTVLSVGDTYFVEQAGKMNRNVVGKVKLPLQVLLLAKKTAKAYLDRKVERLLNRIPYDSAPSFGIAAGMICSILCCVTAALVENERLKVVRRHGLLDKPDENVPMSMYWLLFQFVLLGCMESFLEKSVGAYYRDQSPECMVSYLGKLTQGVSGLGFMCSALLVYVVRRMEPGWFKHTLNGSRFDRYYWLLAALSAADLVVFLVVASCYSYKKPVPEREAPEADGGYGGYVEGRDMDRSCSCSCF